MKFTVLIENTAKEEKYLSQHGLSLYIEALGKKILMDTGQDSGFLENAKEMGIDLGEVDFAVISHFHYDHAGGLSDFLKLNSKAKVYIGKSAFADYYSIKDGEMVLFGLNKDKFDLSRFIFTSDMETISNGIKIVSKLNYGFDNPLNEKFYIKINNDYIKDDFSHEVGLVISEGANIALFSGCFHSGVINAADRVKEIAGGVSHVIGGFHLAGSGMVQAPEEYYLKLKEYIRNNNIKGYTGHCTGSYYLNRLKKDLDGTVYPIFTGAKYTI